MYACLLFKFQKLQIDLVCKLMSDIDIGQTLHVKETQFPPLVRYTMPPFPCVT